MKKRERMVSCALVFAVLLTLLSPAVRAEDEAVSESPSGAAQELLQEAEASGAAEETEDVEAESPETETQSEEAVETAEGGAPSPLSRAPAVTPTIAERFPDPKFAEAVAKAMGCTVDAAPGEEEYALTSLDVKNAEISSIKGIAVFKRLQYLNLSNNSLTQVHAELKNLRELRCLLLHGNQLEVLPDIFNAFPKLSYITLHGNPCVNDDDAWDLTSFVLAKLPVSCDVRLLFSSGWRSLRNRKAWFYQEYSGIQPNDWAQESHRVLRRQWKEFNGNWYYFGDDFLMHVGWLKDGGEWYYLRPESGPEPPGILLSPMGGNMHTGWLKDGGKWYYLKPGSGAMVTGWFKVGKDWYYANPNGAMHTGWLKDGGEWYYLKPGSGAMVTGWFKVGKDWHYANAEGVMETGWLKDRGKWYYLKPDSGAMATGWFKVGKDWYYADKSGAMQTGWLKDGGNWYYLKSSGKMATGWEKIGGKWYCFRSNGAMYHSGTYTIGGKRYRFDSKGVWIP